MLKDALISLSLANLCFSSMWAELLKGSRAYYFMEHSPSRVAFAAILMNVLLLAGVFWLFSRFAKRLLSGRAMDFVRLAFLAVVLVALNSLLRSAGVDAEQHVINLLGYRLGYLLQFVAGAPVVFCAVRWQSWLTRAGKLFVLILSPLVVVTFSQTVWSLISYEAVAGKFAAPPLASPLAVNGKSSRVVWLLFDELDQQIAFDERPAGLQLPEFDRFRAQAIYSTHAYPVAGDTMLAMPGLIMGRGVSKARPVDASTLRVTLSDSGETVDWASQPNIFAKARAAGFNTAVVGFYHPYDRVLRGSLTQCFWWGGWNQPAVWRYSPILTFSETAICQIRGIVEAIPEAKLLRLPLLFMSVFENLEAKVSNSRVQLGLRVLEEAKRVAANRDLGLVLLHLAVPHPPFIYDRLNGQLVLRGGKSYLDNLALADRTLGEIRRVMEDAGIWENSTVLVTSDHWYREKPTKPWNLQGENFALSNYKDHRVPLIVKLAGQQRGTRYEKPINCVIIQDLILWLLSAADQMPQPDGVLHWLDDHRRVAPTLERGMKSAKRVAR